MANLAWEDHQGVWRGEYRSFGDGRIPIEINFETHVVYFLPRSNPFGGGRLRRGLSMAPWRRWMLRYRRGRIDLYPGVDAGQ